VNIAEILEYIGMASGALSGFLVGVKQRCDFFGLFMAAAVTALGGGILRDILVGREMYSFTHYAPFIIVIIVVAASLALRLYRNIDSIEKSFTFIFADAINLVIFSIVGARIALEFGLNFFGVVFVALTTGVGGGILRDIMLNVVPWFLRTGFYGTICLGVGFCYFLMDGIGATQTFFVLVLMCAGVAWRLVAHYRDWRLPVASEI